ncbi:hypothetical protein CYMTET_38082 [Cymbomonas tetramitiformis]|uniref:Uncharacterized protein n=1 Tax=Cymbomonas tetramitiformis TaxID=36881 RepID=A0AAE0F5A2_9CHLO|nr:hypothetical protein CYMTET_38082 [Cymbomonas tetramitiformis]
MTGDFKIKWTPVDERHVYTKVQDFGEVKSTSYWAPTSHKRHVYTKVQDFGEVKSTSYWAPTSHKRCVAVGLFDFL